MAKNYLLQFGAGSTGTTGLTPTFIVFNGLPNGSGAGAAPGITEVPTNTGLYYFTYEPTVAVAFIADGGSSLSAPARWVSGLLDPVSAIDEKIGSLTDSFGSTNTDPTTIFGYLKRNQELQEGDNVFTKSSGNYQMWSRGNTYILGASTYAGSSAMLANKTLTDNGTTVTKT